MLLEALFWGSLGTLLYVFVGFIVVLWIVSKARHLPVQRREFTPSVSVIIAAFNEEKHIRQKIANCQEFRYPKEDLEIVVVSDGSTDDTDHILEQMRSPLLRTCRMPKQVGKTEC